MKINALLLSLVFGENGGGAFGSLWMLDLRDEAMFPGHEIFRVDLPGYGRNLLTMISSHATQYWFRVDAVYVEDPDAIVHVSDVYCKNLLGHSFLKFIGYFSYLLLMTKLLPMFRRGLLPWHEMMIRSNHYAVEVGCTANSYSSMDPLIWFLRLGSETSIIAGKLMFQHFKTIKLPRLIVRNEWNYPSWKPYYQDSGPSTDFVYTPYKRMTTKWTVNEMSIEEQRRWLTKCEKQRLALFGVAKL